MTPLQWVIVSVLGFSVVWALGCHAFSVGVVAWQKLREQTVLSFCREAAEFVVGLAAIFALAVMPVFALWAVLSLLRGRWVW